MADINKRIVVEVDAKDAEQGLAPVRRVLDDITKDAKYSGEAIDTAFENALREATTFEDILKRVKREFDEIGRRAPDFAKERAAIEKEYNPLIEKTSPGQAQQRLIEERQRRLSLFSKEDEDSQKEFNIEFKENSQKLIDALEKLAEAEEKKRTGEESPGYLGGLMAQRSALISQQLAAPTRREAMGYSKRIRSVNKEIATAAGGGRGIGAALGKVGIGAAGAMFGTDMALLGAVGGGLPVIIAELGRMITGVIGDGFRTLQETNRASLVSANAISPGGVTDRNGNLIENNFMDVRTGMSPSERTQYYINYIRQRGMTNQFSGENMYQQALTENAFGLDRGQLMPLERFRMRDTSGTSVNNMVQAFLQVGKQESLFGFDKDNFAQLSDRIGNVIQIMRDQQQNMNSVNMASGFSTLIAGQQIGGRFADRDTQVGLFGQLNNSIRNPGNDFRRAFIYQRLQQAHPGASYFEIMEMMQNGIYGGNLQAVLGGLNVPGAGASKGEIDEYLTQVQGLTGLDFQAAGTLGRSIMRNPNILNTQSTTRLLQQIGANPNFVDLQGRGVTGRAQDFLTLQQDLKSFSQQLRSDLGTWFNKLLNRNDETNTLLKGIMDASTSPLGIPFNGWSSFVPQNNNVTHKPTH